MGASSKDTQLDGKLTEDEVRKIFDKMCEQAAYSSGHEYSGDWNMMNGIQFPLQKFTSYDKAIKWVLDNTQKWGSAMAVKVKEKGKAPYWLLGGWAAE